MFLGSNSTHELRAFEGARVSNWLLGGAEAKTQRLWGRRRIAS